MKISFKWKKSKPFALGLSVDPCLTKDEADRLQMLNFEQVVNMNSEERINAFTEIIGKKKAIFVNTIFEKDSLLSRQKEGLMNWINEDADIEPKWRKEIIREISELNKALDDKELNDFMERLARLKLGLEITRDEFQRITDLCNKIDEAKLEMENGGSNHNYEKACKDLEDYKSELTETS